MSNASFFIIGTERSGTNLLRLILNSHSDVFIPHPPHLVKNFYHLQNRYGDLSKDKNFSFLISDMLKSIKLHPYPWQFIPSLEDVSSSAPKRSVIGAYLAIHNLALKNTLKKIWGCKSTFMIHHVGELLEANPQSKFIFLVRDGRDVAVSAKKSIFNHFNVYFTAKLWQKEQRRGMYWLSKLSNDQIYLLRYEELISDPVKHIQSLCAFLHITYSETMLEFSKTKEAKLSASLSTSWNNTDKEIIKNNKEKFRKELSKEEISVFEAVAFEELSYFGYPLSKNIDQIENDSLLHAKEKWWFSYHEFILMVCAQLHHLCDKNSILRFKKYLFLKYVKYSRIFL